MTEDEIIGRLRQIEQMAQRQAPPLNTPWAVLFMRSNLMRLTIFWLHKPCEDFGGNTAEECLAAAEVALGCGMADRAAIDAYVRQEELISPGVQDALLRLRSAVFAPAITGCPRVMEE